LYYLSWFRTCIYRIYYRQRNTLFTRKSTKLIRYSAFNWIRFLFLFSTWFTRSIFCCLQYPVFLGSSKSFFLSFYRHKIHLRRRCIASCCSSCCVFLLEERTRKRKHINTSAVSRFSFLSAFSTHLSICFLFFC
jgi:hypothetical protein